jgi:hypothetical protein
MRTEREAAGAAALSICESLFLCLHEKGLLTEDEIAGILCDAACAHEAMALEALGGGDARHAAIAAEIRALMIHRDTVRPRGH